MPIQLYDLAEANAAVRFSPHCWCVRLALAHKGLNVETVPWRFTDKEAIVEYLEDNSPDRPKLFGGAQGLTLARFTRHWIETQINPCRSLC